MEVPGKGDGPVRISRSAGKPVKTFVLGAGRGSAELIDFLCESEASGEIVVLDDRWPAGPNEVLGKPVVGRLEGSGVLAASGALGINGIANSRHLGLRLEIARRVALPAGSWLTFVHRGASVSMAASIGLGGIIYPGARIACGATLGDHVVVYYNAVIHHDCKIGDGTIICAGVLVAGGANIGPNSYLGIGAVIRDGIRVGEGSLVGMGAVVTRDVGPGEIVAGVPGRRLR